MREKGDRESSIIILPGSVCKKGDHLMTSRDGDVPGQIIWGGGGVMYCTDEYGCYEEVVSVCPKDAHCFQYHLTSYLC